MQERQVEGSASHMPVNWWVIYYDKGTSAATRRRRRRHRKRHDLYGASLLSQLVWSNSMEAEFVGIVFKFR